jgi:PBP1b-binding outer membrane lipoprotein LpoB
MIKTKPALILILLALVLLVSGCNQQLPTATLAPVETQVTEYVETVVEIVTETAIPTQSVQTLISSDIVLWAGAGSAHNEVLSERLSAFAQANGYTFESHERIEPGQITPSVKVLVATVEAKQIEDLNQQIPGLKIVAVDANGLTPGWVNVHAVTSEGGTPEQRAFLAGYALALTTTDFRVGAITQSGNDLGNRTRDSFVTGVRYFCGLCSARYMPVNYYPFTAEVTAPLNPEDWQAAVDSLLELAVTAMFVQPEISSLDLMTYLASKNITVIGVEGQAGLEAAGKVVGVLGSDLYASVLSAVSGLLAGEEIGSNTGSLELTQINRDLMSDGRHILFERIREDLLNGLIKDRP